MFTPYEIKANETVSISAVFDFNNDNVAKDWSVTAWGDKGTLHVYHDKGIESASLPVAPPKAGDAPPTPPPKFIPPVCNPPPGN